MQTTLICAWCGIQLGAIDGGSIGEPNISHGICPACRGELVGAIRKQPASWDGTERRRGDDRRLGERRLWSTYEADDLVIVSGRTWIDGKRRIKVRRVADRTWLADEILARALDQSQTLPL